MSSKLCQRKVICPWPLCDPVCPFCLWYCRITVGGVGKGLSITSKTNIMSYSDSINREVCECYMMAPLYFKNTFTITTPYFQSGPSCNYTAYFQPFFYCPPHSSLSSTLHLDYRHSNAFIFNLWFKCSHFSSSHTDIPPCAYFQVSPWPRLLSRLYSFITLSLNCPGVHHHDQNELCWETNLATPGPPFHPHMLWRLHLA